MKCKWCGKEIVELDEDIIIPDELEGCLSFHRSCYWDWRSLSDK